jgi:hypothetical protein
MRIVNLTQEELADKVSKLVLVFKCPAGARFSMDFDYSADTTVQMNIKIEGKVEEQ